MAYPTLPSNKKRILRRCYDSGVNPHQAAKKAMCGEKTALKYYEGFGYRKKPRKPSGFYSQKTPEELLSYGLKLKYDKLSRSELFDKDASFYNLALKVKIGKEPVLQKLIPSEIIIWTKENWFKRAREKRYDKLTLSEVAERDQKFYAAG